MNKKKIFLVLGLVVAVAAGVLAFGGSSSLFKGDITQTRNYITVDNAADDTIVEGSSKTFTFRRTSSYTGEQRLWLLPTNYYRGANAATKVSDYRYDLTSSFILDADTESFDLEFTAIADEIEEGEEIVEMLLAEKNLSNGRYQAILRYKFKIVDAAEEVDPVTCYKLRNEYSNDEISASSRLTERAEQCADEFEYIWYRTRPNEEQCAEYRTYFESGVISASRILELYQSLASYCYSEFWSADDGDEDSGFVSDSADLFGDTPVVTARLIKSTTGSNSHKSLQLTGVGEELVSITLDKVVTTSRGEVEVNLEISDSTREDEVITLNAGEEFELVSEGGRFIYDVYVLRASGNNEGYSIVDLALVP